MSTTVAEDELSQTLKGGASALLNIRAVLDAAQSILASESQGKLKMLCLIGGKSKGGRVHILPLLLGGAASFNTDVVNTARKSVLECLRGDADDTEEPTAYIPEEELEYDEELDYEREWTDDDDNDAEGEGDLEPEVIAALRELESLRPVVQEWNEYDLEPQLIDQSDDEGNILDDLAGSRYEDDNTLFDQDPSEAIDPDTGDPPPDEFWEFTKGEESVQSGPTAPSITQATRQEPNPPHIRHSEPIIPWGSDETAFDRLRDANSRYETVTEFHSKATYSALPVIEEPEYLRQFQLGYNTVNDLFVCKNPGMYDGVCCMGLAIDHIVPHLTNRTPSKNYPAHCYKIKPKECPIIKRRLRELYPKAAVTTQDLRSIVPLPGQVGPVAGVPPPVPGYVCKLCSCGYTTRDSANDHWKRVHKGQPPPPKANGDRGTVVADGFRFVAQMQTLTKVQSSAVHYFEIVPEPGVGIVPPVLVMEGNGVNHLAQLHDDVFGPAEAGFNTPVVDDVGIHEFFQNSGAIEHIAGFSPDDLVSLVGLPQPDEPRLVILRRAQMLRFMAACKCVLKGSISVRRLLVTTLPGLPTHKKFNPPAKERSRIAYALEELRLLSMVMRCYWNQQYSMSSHDRDESVLSDGRAGPRSYSLTLTPSQLAAVRDLDECLMRCPYNSHKLRRSICSLTETLYIPENSHDMLSDIFVSPVTCFICLRAVDRAGGFALPKHITYRLVGLQCGIRLCIFDVAMGKWQQVKAAGGSVPADWFEPIKAFISRWSMQTEVSPMATLREWISSLSYFAFNTAPIDLVSWPLENVMLLADHEINVDTYIQKAQKTLQDLRVHLREKVLLNIPITYKIPTVDSQNEKSRGQSMFGSVEDVMSGFDSNAFLGALLKDGRLCSKRPDGSIMWNRPMVNQWLSDINRSWADVYCLLHILSLPGRGSEEILSQWVNSAEGRRHLFLVNGVMALISNYHKGHQTSGLYKQVLRLMPNELGYLICVLLCVVRPIEMGVVAKFFFTQDNDKLAMEAMKKAYKTRIFVTYGRLWTSDHLSGLLKSWWMKNMGLPIAMRLHRQFSVGLQRRRLKYPKYDPRYLIAPQALAHGVQADELNYAKKKGDSSVPLSRQTLFEAVSTDWLSIFQFKDPKVYRALWDDSCIF